MTIACRCFGLGTGRTGRGPTGSKADTTGSTARSTGTRLASASMRATGGFTLLEVLVAFVIAAMALTLLGMAGVAGLRGATLSARYQEAVVRARSRLAVLQVAPVPGDRQGDDGDGFHWHVRVRPLATADLPATHRFGSAGMPSQHLSLLSVAVAVSWGTGAYAVELQTEQVVQETLTPP